MTDSKDGKWSTPPLKAAWFEDDERAENELKAETQPPTKASSSEPPQPASPEPPPNA